MSQVGDWIYEACSTIGQGPLVLTGAVAGFSTFAAQIPAGEVWYAIDENGSREVGIGVFDGVDTIERTNIHAVLTAGTVDKTLPINPLYLTGQALVACTFNARAYQAILDHINNTTNPHNTTADQIPYDPSADPATTSVNVQEALEDHGNTINTILGTYLPLTGGTLTGSLTVQGSVTANQFNGSGAGLTNLPWASVTGRPTTLSGYGITDAVTLNTVQTITAQKTFSGGVVANNITGTAVTQSATDSTAGRLLKVGDAGLLTNSSPSIAGTDLLSVNTFGRNVTIGDLGAGLRGSLINIAYDAATYTAQILANRESQNDLRFRTHNGTAWGNWNQLIHSGNSGSIGLVNGTSDVRIPTANTDIIARTAGTERFRITASGAIATGGETAPDVDAGGLCVNTGVADGYAVTLKNADSAHVMTAIAQSDTYLSIGKRVAAGGVNIQALTTERRAIMINGFATTITTDMTQEGIVTLRTGVSDGGTSITAAGGNANCFALRNNIANLLALRSDGFQFNSNGISTGGELSPDVDNGGLCLNHGGGDSRVMTFKNSDVAHPFTAIAEADTYAHFSKISANIGGLYVKSFIETGYTAAMWLEGYTVTPATAPLTAGQFGNINLNAMKTDGATAASSLSGTEKLFSICNNSNIKFDVMGNGNTFITGGLSTGGEVAPDVDLGGACFNQGAGTGSLITGKSSSVTQPFTAYESDTYLRVAKVNSSAGGAEVVGLSSSASGVRLIGFAGVPNTSGAGVVRFDAIKHNGSGGNAALASNEQAFTFYNSGTLLATIKGSGDQLIAGVITQTAPASTAVGPLHSQVVIPNTVGNRSGISFSTAAGGALAGIAVEVVTAGIYPNSVGKLDFWVQNAATTNRVASFAADGNLSLLAGVQFGGSGAFLNTYQEGTWTPSVSFETPGDLSVSYTSARLGAYTRVGRKVTVTCTFVTSSFTHTTASGHLLITGLPFPCRTLTNLVFVGSADHDINPGAGNISVVTQTTQGQSYLKLKYVNSSGVSGNISTVHAVTGANINLRATITYEA